MTRWTEGPEWRGVVWDLAHGGIAQILLDFALLWPAFAALPGWVRLAIVTTVWPIVVAEAVWDGLLRGRLPYRTGPGGDRWSVDSLHDPLTYQWPWALYLWRLGHFWPGLAVAVVCTLYIAWWNVLGGKAWANRRLNP